MERNKKILLIVGIIVVMGLSIFTYQTYFVMPEFKNETLVKGLQISIPADSNFVSNNNSTFHDNKTNMSIRILKSENDVVDANVKNPKETINYNSSIIMVFENYTVVTNKNKEIGIKISNINNVRENIVMKMAESVILSPSLKSKKISEEKANKIATESKEGADVNYYAMTATVYSNAQVFSSELSIHGDKIAYKIVVSYRVGGAAAIGGGIYMREPVIRTDTIYVDAYTGKIL